MTTPTSSEGINEHPPQSYLSSLLDEEKDDVWLPLEQHDVTTQSSILQRQSHVNPQFPRKSASTHSTLALTQRRLQTKMILQEKLIDHPFSKFGGLFVRHFVLQLWELDLHVRFGVAMVIIGLVLQTMAMAWRCCTPSAFIVVLLFGVSFVYMAPKDMEQQWVRLFQILVFSPTRWIDLLQYGQLRNFFLCTFLIPTWLELKTLGFLSMIVVEFGWRANLTVSGLLVYAILYQSKYHHITYHESLRKGVLVLYGCALVLAMYNYRFSIVPKVGGPFCLSTGTLLVSLGEWTVITRCALRLTLRDMLATVSQNVQEDEMLQLAMLRWLVDYWSSTSDKLRPVQQPNGTETNTAVTSIQPSAPPSRQPTPSPINTSIVTKVQPNHDIQWNEMWTMLFMTTDQMEGEIPTAESQGRPSTTHNSSSSEPNHSLHNLTTMLASMDVDVHAKPAVDAYKQVVASIPPTPQMALFIAILRRCPAAIILLWRYFNGSSLAFSSTLLLLPFIVIEVYRVLSWAEACHRATMDVFTPQPVPVAVVTIPQKMDAMTILLSDDNYLNHRPPTLLQVWFNVQASVTALDMGLTTARCAQTTAAAADFAGHILSLAHLGVEVSNHGWLHGLTVLVQELVHMHAAGGNVTRRTKYTSAAIGAVRNGTIVAKNVQILSEENILHPALDPVIGILALVAGRGWLWGHEQQHSYAMESTVEITEITNEEEEPLENNSEILATTTPTTSKDKPKVIKRGGPSDTNKEDLSSLMEMIADTYERGLIAESEKDSFMLMLSQETKPSIIEGIHNSLRCAISNVEQSNETPIHNKMRDKIVTPHVSTSNLQVLPPDPKNENNVVLSQCSSWEEMHTDYEEKVEPLVPEPIYERVTSARSPETEEPSRDEGNSNDLLKWFGGGLAVVGAVVVGGVALMNSANRDDNNTSKSSKHVTTVDEFQGKDDNDDEGNDTWVTVSSDYLS